MMDELLFLAHRIPYPPDKGDKIRSFHELKHLSRSFRIHLGAFVDAPGDFRYAANVAEFCESTCLLPLIRWRARCRSLGGLLTGEALTIPYYRDRRMQDWVASVVETRPLSAVLVFSSAMAQYVANLQTPRRILDFVDVDSEKWRQYGLTRRWPSRWLYRREGERLLAYDRAMATRFDQLLFVSHAEASLFRRLVPEASARVAALENGVDAEFFRDRGEYLDPYPEDHRVLVFTGAMDYWPNVDAVTWFANEVFPAVREACPKALFYIVGAHPDSAVRALQDQRGIRVTGRVDDVRPYLSHACLALAPLRVARGVQNKVLEAMAMGKHLLATPQAVEGIALVPGLDVAIADAAADWVCLATAALSVDSPNSQSDANRAFVARRYDWRVNLSELDGICGADSASQA